MKQPSLDQSTPERPVVGTASRAHPTRSGLRVPVGWAITVALALAMTLAGCANLAPTYEVPAVQTPVAFKEGQGAWVPAAPADTLERGPWWELFDDPVLSRLAAQVEVSNNNVAAAVAAYRTCHPSPSFRPAKL